MNSLWEELPEFLRDSGALDALKPVLDGVPIPESTVQNDPDGTWRVFPTTLSGVEPLSLDSTTGTFVRGASGTGNILGADSHVQIEFPNPEVGIELALRLTENGLPDGSVRLMVNTSSATLRLPFLRGATLDDKGQLRADPENPNVRFLLPALRIRFLRLNNDAISVKLLSAATGPAVEQVYDFVRMEPAHALIGPGEVVGFAFRTAVLDLSGTSGPNGAPPPQAHGVPGDWQGLYLPEARLFVAPSGLEGLAVNAGVRNLWIGIGQHAGVTGEFDAEVVHRGANPIVRLRFQTPEGEWIGVPDDDPAEPVDLPEAVRLYVDAGSGLAPFAYLITVDGRETSGDRIDITIPAAGSRSVGVTVRDASGKSTTRTITVQRRTARPSSTAVTPPSLVTVRQTSSTGSRIVIVSQTKTKVTVRLEPGGGSIRWSWDGVTKEGSTVEVPVTAGAPVSVTAVRTLAAESLLELDAYMTFDRPSVNADAAFADNPENTHAQPFSSRTGWGTSPPFLNQLMLDRLDRLARVPLDISWTVEGWASFEGDDSAGKRAYNLALSERRRDVLIRILQTNGFEGRVTAGTAHGHASARDSSDPPPSSSIWWRARATAMLPRAMTETVTAELTRPANAPEMDIDPEPSQRLMPDCFRKIGVRVELIRSTIVRAEIYGEFDVLTAAEQQLARTSPDLSLPRGTNAQDGICAFLVRLRIAEDRSSWDVTADFRAVEGDLDGLAQVKNPGGENPSTALNVLGAVAVLAPLLAEAAPLTANAGELVPMVILPSIAAGIGASGVMQTQYVILRGGELVVTDGLVDPASGSGPRTTQVSVLLDVETAFTFDLGFVKVLPEKPIVTRYQAAGVQATWQSHRRDDGSAKYMLLPVFDPSRGYTLDVPASSLIVAEPLGEILRILGVRVSRDNPAYFEVEVGMGVDLGIITMDTARVRLNLDDPSDIQLTKLGASLDVPGSLHGTGYIEITSGGFSGSFDLTVVPLNVRGSAQLALKNGDGVTGVLLGVEVEFPVPIPLASSGIGIFGVMGGLGINYQRLEPGNVQNPSLSWLESQLATTGGVMDPVGWELQAGSYALAAGLLLGTAEGGFVFHLKGIAIIEVPGPRLLLVMKADILKFPPALRGESKATFLAVIDLDFGRGTLTIGVIAEYSITSLLKIRVSVDAFFDTNHIEQWYVDLGTFTEPVTVTILDDVFTGKGYLMIHGNGIRHPKLPLVSNGLTIAVGFQLQAVFMGSKAFGLFFEASAEFDALVSFEPFGVGGRIYASGELRLFIVGIAASAELTVLVGRKIADGTEDKQTYVHGAVCGEVDFFFFSIGGCVSLTIGSTPDAPEPPPLVAGVKLVSRSPALVEGSATDRAVDGVLADAVEVGDSPTVSLGDLPTVPLDAVPVILFRNAPAVGAGNIVLGGVAAGASGLPADPWVRRGDKWLRYRITGVDLIGDLQPPEGKTPATWWARGLPSDPQHGPALALLSWLPTPTPRAVPYGKQLNKMVEQRWGQICDPVAAPAPVLWTFDGQPVGPSPPGWQLHGTPWPDVPGTYRSNQVTAPMTVVERWRTGDSLVDRMLGVEPARIVGDAVPCPTKKFRRVEGLEAWMIDQPSFFSSAAPPTSSSGLLDIANLLANGKSLHDVAAHWNDEVDIRWKAWRDKHPDVPLDCQGHVLRSPFSSETTPAPDTVERPLIEEARRRTGIVRSELKDSLLLRVAEGLLSVRLLLLVPGQYLEGQLVLVFRDITGAETGKQEVNSSHIVGANRPLPPEWTDSDGPWADAVERAGRIAARIAASEKEGGSNDLYLVLVEAALPKNEAALPRNTVELEIGLDGLLDQVYRKVFWLVAMEGMVASETLRQEWDQTTLQLERDALETAITQDPDDHALFKPGQTYTVRVRWQSEMVQQEAKPAANAPENFDRERVQAFTFAADPASEVPTDLAPWILASAPSMGETGVLCGEPVRIALASQKVVDLFGAYGEELRVLVRAASGRHPEPIGEGAANTPVTIPSGEGKLMKAAPADLSVMTPWQQAVTELPFKERCIDYGKSRTHHHVIELGYVLEPLTNYLLDVIAVPKGSKQDAVGRRVHRVGFTTSRFATVDELANLIRLSPVDDRLLPVPAALEALNEAPAGDQLDAAFQAAGLGVPQVPRYPCVQVLWGHDEPDEVPLPVAVVVECSEPMWRDRPMPQVVKGPVDASDPEHEWWAPVRQDWLSLAVGTSANNPGEPQMAEVTRLIKGPGGTRAVALLAPGSRGKEVRLDLVITADALAGTQEKRAKVVRVVLLRAPWEVED